MDPGTKMPSCPSLSYTASFTGMMVPSYSTWRILTWSLSPCMRPSPMSKEFLGRTCFPTRIGSCSLILTPWPLITVWFPWMQARMVFLTSFSSLWPIGVWNLSANVLPVNDTESQTGCGNDDTTGVETNPTGTAFMFPSRPLSPSSGWFSLFLPPLPGMYLAASS